MFKYKLSSYKYILTILLLIFLPLHLQFIYSEPQKGTGTVTFEAEEAVFWGETTIEVIEGELTVYEFAKRMGDKEIENLFSQELIDATIFKVISNNKVKIMIGREIVIAYIPEHLRRIIRRYGYSGMPILVVANKRYDTDWDIIALGKTFKAGETYVSGTIFPVVQQQIGTYQEQILPGEPSYNNEITFPEEDNGEEEDDDVPPDDVPPKEPETLEITTTSVDNAVEEVGYGYPLAATGGTTPYTWSLTSGPSWLSINAGTGRISGTPPVNSGGRDQIDPNGRDYNFTAKVEDGSQSATKTLTLKVGYKPKGVTNYAWIANGGDNNVTRVLRSLNAVSNTTQINVGTAPWGVAVDDLYVWVTNNGSNTVTRITKSDRSITSFNTGPSPTGVAVDNNYVWVSNSGDNTVSQLTKSSGSVVSLPPISVGTSPQGIAVDSTYVWVANNGSNNVTRITKSDRSTTPVDLGAGNNPFGVAVGDTYAWVTIPTADTYYRIDKEEDPPVANAIGTGDGPMGIAVDDTYVWIAASNEDKLRRTDKSLTPSAQETLVGDQPSGVAFDGTYAWVTSNNGANVTRAVYTVASGWVKTDVATGTSPVSYGDTTGYNYDQFWTSSATADPHIYGRVYDSVTGENVTDVYTSLYRYRDGLLMGTTTSNPYSFNIDVANYYLRVEKEGYTFPSKDITGRVAGDHGEVFQGVNEEYVIDIPIDPGYSLTVTKTATKKEVTVGDIITFNIAVNNDNSIATLNDIIIEDEITAGFKYVDNSLYFDSDRQEDPTITSRVASFNIGKIPRYTTINVSYQVRVGTGVVPGTYKTDAVAKDSVRGWQMSEEDGIQIDVIKDPLFELGTIIGKVFIDSNDNGIQDGETEVGVPNVKLATEYGVIVYTDEAGRYHIPAVPPGLHAVKIDTNGLPPFVTLTTELTYIVDVTEGILRKVNFGLQGIDAEEVERRKEQFRKDWAFSEDREIREEENLSGKENWFFLVALGEGVVKDLTTSGNIKMVDHDERFKDGVRVNGRLAYYLKAKVLGKFLITSSLDTNRKQNKLFTNLDPDKYYPVYGDASQIDYSAADTQNEFYLMVEYETSYLMWGDFRTDIPAYQRTLNGAKLHFESTQKTKFDDPYTTAKAFFANARQRAAHDEFLGTGTSLYYLRHKPVIEGSEMVHVEVRHQLSRAVLTDYALREEIDYEVDYDSGRILLKKPLNSVDYLYTDSIISNDILRGNRVFLVVDYEYKPDSGIRFDTWGVRATQHVTSHVKVGGTYVNEQKADTHYEFAEGDVMFKLNEETEIRGAYGYSEETQLGSSISADGGLSFVEESDTFSQGESGNAWSVSGKTTIFKNTNINAAYIHQDPYYSTTNSLATQGTRRLIANIVSYLTDNLIVGLNHVTQRLQNDTERVQSFLTGANRTHTTTALISYNKDKYDLRVEYQHQRVVHPITDYTYMGSIQFHDNDFIAGRVGYRITDWLRAYIRGQATVSGRVNNQVTVGSDIKVGERIFLTIGETVGNLGNSTLLGVTSKYGEDSDIYANIEVGSDAHAGSYTKTAYGQTSYLGRTGKVFVETDYSSYNESIIRGNVIGYEKEIGDNLALGINYERSFVQKDPRAFSRDAGSVRLSYLNEDRIKLFTKIECREDNSDDITRYWLTQNELMWYLNQDISVLGRANYSRSRDRTAHNTVAEFKEMGVGLAYRPVKFDRLNLLGKYSYIEDDSPEIQSDFPFSYKNRKHVYAVEGAFDLFRYLQLVGKFAYKDSQEKVEPRDYTESDTYLYIGRINFHVTKKWDLAGEYRVLRNTQADDRRSGWLVEVNRELMDHVWLGGGYNFTDFDDDLEQENSYDAKGWFIRVVGKY